MRTEGTSIVAALVLHAGVILVARAMPPLSSLVEQNRRPVDTIEILTLPPSVPAPEPREMPVAPEAPRPQEPQRPEPQASVEPRAVPRNPGPQAPATAEPVNPPPTPAPKTQFDQLPDEHPPGTVLGVPGLGGPAAWAMPGVIPGPSGPPPPAPTVAPAARAVPRNIATKVLNDELAKNDKALGLDLPMAGTMSSAVRTAVQSSEIPAGTQGTIECRVSPGGAVSGCRLVGSNGGSSAGWSAAVRAAGAVAGAALSGRYASGAVVTISVSITNTPPAGGKGGLQGAGASFDLANIGAHATRMVRTSHRVVAAR